MNTCWSLWAKAVRLVIPGILFFLVGPSGLRAQFLIVDCSGTNLYAYPSINAALPNAGPGAFILVTGPCTENVLLFGRSALNLGAFFGQTATINGTISIGNSDNIFLYGLNVTNPSGNGISVNSSRSIALDSCTSNGNAGVGLNVGGMSDVTVLATGAFDNNTGGGMNITGNSIVNLIAFAGLADISNNRGPGIFASQANVFTLGNTNVSNNVSGFGLDLRGGTHAQMLAIFGPNSLTGNQSGGASLQETAEISFFSIGPPNLIQSNGPVGVSAGLGSQATFFNDAQITDHSGAGIDLYGNSQAYLFGTSQVLRNGSATDARSAGIRVDGNSEAFLRGGQVSGNAGPGMLVLVNSSADFSGVSFSGNNGVISCDSSSTMVSDLAGPSSTPPAGVSCRTPHGLGGRQITKTQPAVPDWSAQKAQHDSYAKLAVKH